VCSSDLTKLTFSAFIKRGALGTIQYLWSGNVITVLPFTFCAISLTAGNAIRISATAAATTLIDVTSTGTISDTTNWHSICVNMDTTQATAANRISMWVDEAPQSLTFTITPTQNLSVAMQANGVDSDIGSTFSGNYYNGLMDQVYFIDNQALNYTSFSSGNKPIVYSGSYTGTIDTFLNFEDSTSTSTLGTDLSGEGNNWTLNNMTTANSSTDVP
jgi:hypothetical protein